MVNGGISNGNIYINAMTEERHTKKDSSYTIIYVPKQEDYTYNGLDLKFLFNNNDTAFACFAQPKFKTNNSVIRYI